MPHGVSAASAATADTQVQQLGGIIAQHVPVTTLAEVVMELGLVPDFDLRRRVAPAEPEAARRYLADLAAAAAADRRALPTFARALYRRLWQDSELVSLLVPFMEERKDAGEAQEAALALRARTLRLPDLRRQLVDWEKWICVVAAAQAGQPLTLGTGVLIGPDLVLTAYHNVKTHVANSRARDPLPGELVAIFDHLDGEPVSDLRALHPGCVAIPFHKEWLVAFCEDMAGDGKILHPDETQQQELQRRLDFAVVRLAEPIGRWARNTATGGARRRWLSLVRPSGALSQDDRIIIPQHPAGAVQRIDFGRFVELATTYDTSCTRLRYNTESARGTSGAPCFNQHFHLVGVHNATFQPEAEPVANQAVRLERILDHLRDSGLDGQLLADNSPPASALWNVSSDQKSPRVILGRRILLHWIERAAAESTVNRANRVYAAVCRGEGQTSTTGFGKSFSIEILRAARRDRGERVVVLGTRDGLLPTTAPDVLQSMVDQLGISATVLSDMPPRPAADASGGVGATDKLLRWASEEVPVWFSSVLGAHRQQSVDLIEEAKAEVRFLEQYSRPVPDAVRAMAQSAPPRTEVRSRWDLVWIALDRLAESRMSDEVRNLLAGLTGGKWSEAAMPPELRRLRWLFLGYVPDFLSVDEENPEVTPEVLDPTEIGADAVIAALEALAAGLDKPLEEQSAWLARTFFDAMSSADMWNAEVNNPNTRLGKLQSVFPPLGTRIRATLSK